MRNNVNSSWPVEARKLVLGALATGVFLVAYTQWVSPAQAAPAPKVEICHIPPGNPANFHTIKVSDNAVSAHLAHGDAVGACNDVCAILCDDGDACTMDDTGDCESQGCPAAPRQQVDCNDGNQCTDDSCDAATGCMNPILAGEPCDDGMACTDDLCDEFGVCVGTQVTDCCTWPDDDNACGGNFCNGRSCDDVLGTDRDVCVSNPPCVDDDLSCTADFCNEDDMICVVEEVDASCPDPNICTRGVCRQDGPPPSGCEFVPDDTLCPLGDACHPLIGCDPAPSPAGGCQYDDRGPTCCLADADCPPTQNLCARNRCDQLLNECVETPVPCPSGTSCNPANGQCEPDAPAPCFDASDCFNSGLSCLINACEDFADCPDEGRRPFDHFGAIIDLAGQDCAFGRDPASCWVVNQGLIDQGCLNVCGETGPPPPGSALCECLDVNGNPGAAICVPMLNSCPPPNFDVQCANTCAINGFGDSSTQCLDQGCP